MKNFRKKYLFMLIGFLLPISIWLIELGKDSLVGEILISILPLLLSIVTILIFAYTIVLKKVLKNRHFYTFIVICLIMLSPFYYKIINFYFSPNPIYSSTKGPSEGSLKIISFNILYTNKDLDPTIDLIRQEKPDIIFVYEMKPDQYEGLQNALSPEYSAYPSLVDNGVFTKLNLNLNYENRIENNYSYRKVSLTYNQKDYHIYAIHPAAPIAQKYREHRDIYMEKLVADINLNSNSNIVVVGDFNMTPWAKAYEDFKINTKNIFTDIAQGKGYDDTWSPIPNPFIGVDYLDHIWITNQVKPLTYKSIIVKGSDHKALIFNFN